MKNHKVSSAKDICPNLSNRLNFKHNTLALLSAIYNDQINIMEQAATDILKRILI